MTASQQRAHSAWVRFRRSSLAPLSLLTLTSALLTLHACGDDGGPTDGAVLDSSAGGDSSAVVDSAVPTDSSGPPIDASADAPVGDGGAAWAYGANGPYGRVDTTFDNPAWPSFGDPALPVQVHLPEGLDAPAPALFFSHGFGATDPDHYGDLITHLVSWGFAVIVPPYPTELDGMGAGIGYGIRYQVLWTGFEEAVRRHAANLDLSRVGFLGHSFGGGATPAMAHRGIVGEGWGTAGAFIFSMAPWYSYDIGATNVAMPDTKLAGFPEHVRMIIQVYDDDDVNDHRMAVDLYEHLTLPDGQAAYHNVLVNGDYPAGHNVPASAGPSGGVFDELDRTAVWTHLDALIDSSFAISDPAAATALSLTPGARPPYVAITTTPVAGAAEGSYRFRWSDRQNLRD